MVYEKGKTYQNSILLATNLLQLLFKKLELSKKRTVEKCCKVRVKTYVGGTGKQTELLLSTYYATGMYGHQLQFVCGQSWKYA
jgi:hypothetical protein